MPKSKRKTRKSLQELDIPSLDTCISAPLPPDKLPTYRDLIYYRRHLLDINPDLEVNFKKLHRQMLPSILEPWSKISPHLVLKTEEAMITMLKEFFFMVRNPSKNMLMAEKVAEKLPRVANFSKCKCNYKKTVDCE